MTDTWFKGKFYFPVFSDSITMLQHWVVSDIHTDNTYWKKVNYAQNTRFKKAGNC